MIGCYDRQGKPISDTLEWARLFEDKVYQHVAETTLPNGKWVSTVWLGLNHRYADGPPLIFETMVFAVEGQWDERDCKRYSTEQEALTGHEAMVKKWSQKEARDEQ